MSFVITRPSRWRPSSRMRPAQVRCGSSAMFPAPVRDDPYCTMSFTPCQLSHRAGATFLLLSPTGDGFLQYPCLQPRPVEYLVTKVCWSPSEGDGGGPGEVMAARCNMIAPANRKGPSGHVIHGLWADIHHLESRRPRAVGKLPY